MVALFSRAGLAQETPPDAKPISKYTIDKDRQIFSGIDDDRPIRSEGENPDEYLAYNEVVLFASQFPHIELEAHARQDVMYKDLMSRFRSDFKLELVQVEGRLGRLRKVEPNKQLAAAGVKTLYEGWVFPKGYSDPLCVLISELPDGLKPELAYSPTPHVKFSGYYFKVLQYERTERDTNNPSRGKLGRAPFLIGKSLTVLPDPPFSPGEIWHNTFMPVLFIALGTLAVVGFGLAWWFRKGDRGVKQLIHTRAEQNPFSA
jgi:hypothetical protein